MVMGVPNIRCLVSFLIVCPIEPSHGDKPAVYVRFKKILTELFIVKGAPLVGKFNVFLNLTEARAVAAID